MRKIDPVKHETKRLGILEAAETCFVRKGFHGASISDICAAARISPGHLYHYFDGKEAIVSALAEVRLEAATEAMEEVLAGPDPLDAFLKEICRPRSEGMSALRLELLAEAGRNPVIGETMQEQSRRVLGLFSDVVRKGQADGRIDPQLDPDLAAGILSSVAVDGMKALTVKQPDVDRDRARDMLELLVKRFLGMR